MSFITNCMHQHDCKYWIKLSNSQVKKLIPHVFSHNIVKRFREINKNTGTEKLFIWVNNMSNKAM